MKNRVVYEGSRHGWERKKDWMEAGQVINYLAILIMKIKEIIMAEEMNYIQGSWSEVTLEPSG